MRHILSPDTAWKFAEYGRNVWGITCEDDLQTAREAIDKTASFFFDTMKMPGTLSELGIGEDKLEEMAAHAAPACTHAFVPLSQQDILAIYRDSMRPF